MENSKKWALGFVVTGVICLGLFTILSAKPPTSSYLAPEVAVAELFAGEASVLRSQYPQKEKLSGRKWIRALESVETGLSTELVLEFNSNFRVKLNSQSLVSLDSGNVIDVIIIKRGDLSFENYGREGSLFILKEGQKISATDYGLNQEKQGAPRATGAETAAALKNAEPNRLSQKMIQDILTNVKTQFYKCYSQLLQKTPGVNGQASIAFLIQPSGHVSQPEVASSTLSDPDFKKCLLSIIERVEFPAFSGSAISTEFPIRFE